MSSFFFRELKHMAGRILDFIAFDYRTMLPLENYEKLYFDEKHLKKGLNKGVGWEEGVKFLGPLFKKRWSFL